ncbi:MAG TPA: YhcH/YjgK/YiaL family protein [Bacteroidales bacterium]|nr:YhcH/YjgK/YiaL family protein [Bacteroidales bacterium]
MVLDKIENSGLYKSLHPRFDKAFEYIQKTDFSLLDDGKYEIEGENIFALVQEYNTKDAKDAKPEAHKKYIDIQYIHSGTELIGVATLKNQVIVVTDPEKDITFFDGETSLVKLEAGMFAIFFPGDLHMPGILETQPAKVKKVVIKVKSIV